MKTEYQKAIKESGGWGMSYINWGKFIKKQKEVKNKDGRKKAY